MLHYFALGQGCSSPCVAQVCTWDKDLRCAILFPGVSNGFEATEPLRSVSDSSKAQVHLCVRSRSWATWPTAITCSSGARTAKCGLGLVVER